ncbi:MAG TPA: tetratricopeptide repeat protein [Xanthobacteraceae bacterium]|jgi:tetratricopeptide (TPR) repeat protein
MKRLASFLFCIMVGSACVATTARADDNADHCFKDDGEAALAACTRAIQSGKFNGATLAALYHDRAIELRQKQEYERAIADYSQAIHIDAEFTGAYAGRGLAYEGAGEPDKARTDYRKALALAEKYDDGKWAHDVATERLKALGAK